MPESTNFPFPSHLVLTQTPSTASTPSTSPSTTSSMAPTQPESMLSKLSNLYVPLPRFQQIQLLQITHFIHLHACSLKLTAYDLLVPVEQSLLSRCGKPYEALLRVLSVPIRNEAPTLDKLLCLAECQTRIELRENYHKPYPETSAKSGPNPVDIHLCSRPLRVQDSRNDYYVWVRGCFNVSPRIARNDVLLKDPLKHAERLRLRGGRKDVFVSGWIVSRIESAERVASRVRIEGERMERQIKERVEREERERLDMGVMTRTKRLICYAESEDEQSEDEDDFVCEQLDDVSDDEEETESSDTRVIGRVRVCVSDRTRRAERRARLDNDADETCVRRSKRLRMMKR